jgi:hypothetical protein
MALTGFASLTRILRLPRGCHGSYKSENQRSSNLRSSLWRALRVRQWRLRHTPHRDRPLVAAETVPAQKAYRVIHQVRECETCIP